MKLGCVADDLTGATDLANELVAQGLSTVQMNGVPTATSAVPEVDAIVVALKSRSIDAGAAVDRSLAAVRWLRAAGCTRFYFKYCSTFDSTSRGNIGPVLEALAAELDAKAVVACPAFPATGRTVYQGHLFVGDRLVSETGMRDHPLTPMTDADLVRVLGAQMRGEVALLRHQDLVAGRAAEQMAQWAAQGVGAVIADAIDEADLVALGAWCAGVPLASGASGLGAGIARALAGAAAGRASAALPQVTGGRAIVAGSCSVATRRQVAAAQAHYPSHRILLERGGSIASAIAVGKAWIDTQRLDLPLLLFSTASPEEIAAQRAMWGDGASAALETVLAELAAYLVDRGTGALLVAGGETSGAVVERLGCDRLAIGPEIDPGVPWTVAHRPDGPPLLLALKSGNFGTDDFLLKAWDHLT